MNDRSNNTATLSVKELEELCRLYLDCRLTRLQERELHYVLLHTEASTELIDEVRGMMDFALRLSEVAENPVVATLECSKYSSVAIGACGFGCNLDIFLRI